MKKLILIVLFVLLPLAALVRTLPEPEAVEIPAPQIAKKTRLPRIVMGPLKRGESFIMATYQMTGAAVGAANQNYTGASTPFVGATDSSYELNVEPGPIVRLRQGSTILYFNDTIVGIYENDPVDNPGDVSTPEVTDVSAPSGGGSGGLLLKYKQQQ